MQVFKTALKIFLRHKTYIAIYMVALSFMAIFLGVSSVDSPRDKFVAESPSIAVFDRDGSDLSKGLVAYLDNHTDRIELEDSRVSMQNAIAQNLVVYIMIIPEGFGESFMAAATENSPTPTIETVVSYESIAANMINVQVNEYLSAASIYAGSGTTESQAKIAAFVENDLTESAEVTMVQFSESGPLSQQWIIFMQCSSYTLILSIVVCIGIVLSAFNRTEIRRRDFSAPISSLSMNLQITAACLIVVLLAWAWVSILGLVVFGASLSAVDPLVIGLIVLALLAFCFVALAISFLMGQITSSELLLNAVGNITGLTLAFLGGVFVAVELMGDTIAAISRFTPTFYYSDTIAKAASLQDFTLVSLEAIFVNIGIILLFATAIFAIALVVGRVRMQSAEAGGNAAAARTRS